MFSSNRQTGELYGGTAEQFARVEERDDEDLLAENDIPSEAAHLLRRA